MSKATLAVLLSRLEPFEQPKTHLEQYPTPSEAAATILWDASQRGLVRGKHVVDLGAGTGILGIGALVLGAKKVTFVEVDQEASQRIERNVALAQERVEGMLGTHEVVIADVTKGVRNLSADLVVSNPPFGTKRKGADVSFLKAALAIAPACYTFHKSVTERHVAAAIVSLGAVVRERFTFTFGLPPTMRQHEKKAHLVAITCFHATKDL